jgi:murein DD-endopeptidase MepM/ murein hydrolase activator NlpD
MERPSSLAAGCFFIALLLLLTLARPLHAQEEAGAYTVAPGDTLGAIAAQLGVSLDALITANAIDDPNHIRVGQVLLVPNADGTMPAAAVAAITTTAIVRAAAGDTLATLAARYELDPALVAELNGVPITRRLFPGQPMNVPESAAPPPAVSLGAIAALDAPAEIVQGRTGRVYITSSRPLDLIGRWNGQPLTFTPLSDDGLHHAAFIPVDALLEPGAYPLEVGYTTARGVEIVRAWPVSVIAGPYDFQEIVISQEKADILTPDVVVAERDRVIAIWSQINSELWWRDVFQRPIGADYPTTSPFGTRRTYSVADIGSFHAGQDFGAPEGTLILAPAPGIVVLAEPLAVRGNAVIIDHGQGV